jgi:hypothetical protein
MDLQVVRVESQESSQAWHCFAPRQEKSGRREMLKATAVTGGEGTKNRDRGWSGPDLPLNKKRRSGFPGQRFLL